MTELSQIDVNKALLATKSSLFKHMKYCISYGLSRDAGSTARSLVRACRPDLSLQLIEEPVIWSCDAEEEKG